jgi:hypothetical protein
MSSFEVVESKSPRKDANFIINQNEIDLMKKASRAFAVCYSNQLYKTIRSNDPSLVNKLIITRQYPYYLHLFIFQKSHRIIDELIIFSEAKSSKDGLCEVISIDHSREEERALMEKRMEKLQKRCIKWKWISLELPKMFMMAISEGKKVGQTICSTSVYSQIAHPDDHQIPPQIPVTPQTTIAQEMKKFNPLLHSS